MPQPLIRTPPSSNDSSWLKQGKDYSNCVFFCHLVMAFAIIRHSFRQPVVAFANICNSVADVGAYFGPLLHVEFFNR